MNATMTGEDLNREGWLAPETVHRQLILIVQRFGSKYSNKAVNYPHFFAFLTFKTVLANMHNYIS